MEILLTVIEIEIGWKLLTAIIFMFFILAVAFGNVPRDR